jgi:hypothetical protein
MLKDFVWKCGYQLLSEVGALYKSCSMSSAVCVMLFHWALQLACDVLASAWQHHIRETLYCHVICQRDKGSKFSSFHISLLYIYPYFLSHIPVVHLSFLPFTYPCCTFILSSFHISLLYIYPYFLSHIRVVHLSLLPFTYPCCTFILTSFHISLLYIYPFFLSHIPVVHLSLLPFTYPCCRFIITSFHISLLYIYPYFLSPVFLAQDSWASESHM